MEDQRICIKFCVKNGFKCAEIFWMLQTAYGDAVMSHRRGFERFKEGREETADNECSGRPSTSTTPEKVDKVLELVREDRRITVREVAEKAGISFGSTQSIMKEILGVRRLNAVLVPKDLTFDQKNARKETASLNLEATTDDPELLKRVITGNETWIYGFDSETTQQASEWRFKNEPRPKKARKAPSNVKVMLTVFFDYQGIVHHDFQQQGSTITADSYLGVLGRLKEAIRQKRPELWRSKSWILHHDKAPAHTALKISKFLQDHSTSVFPQPPYSPDLAPCDFFLFGKLRKKIIMMDSEQFRENGAKLLDYILHYLDKVESRSVIPFIEPGTILSRLPSTAPRKPESFQVLMKDLDSLFVPGMTHLAHPKFHGYFPTGRSFPSLLATMLSDGIGIVGFSWISSPACFELEVVMMDWFAQLLGLPRKFLNSSNLGGGVIQSSASDSMLASMIAARHFALKVLRQQHPTVDEGVLLARLIAYCSREAHSCIEKSARMIVVKLRVLDTNDTFQLTGRILAKAIRNDMKEGLAPFFVCATLGTPTCCSCDRVQEIGPLCEVEGIWFHVEAAYAGAAMILPEYGWLRKGLRYASSINVSPHKWLLISPDCSCLWVQDKSRFTSAFEINPTYLKHSSEKPPYLDLRNWGIPLTRRFRSLKLWFLFRLYGVQKLRQYLRNHIKLTRGLTEIVKQDKRFDVCASEFGLLCFRLRESNEVNEAFLKAINESGKLYMVPAMLKGKFVLRFIVCHPELTDADIRNSWKIISDYANKFVSIDGNDIRVKLLKSESEPIKQERKSFGKSFIARVSSIANTKGFQAQEAECGIIHPFAPLMLKRSYNLCIHSSEEPQIVDHLLFGCPAFLRHRIQTAILLGLTHLNPISMASLPDSTSAWKFLVNWFNSAIKPGQE
ncbi:Tdc2 [Cordylochernes scorpioides]|uniref:Tdc2 n=1 Tax=Cordylochernes scorpioides TaxID=51811 RepID=A0ABY6K912_9ARAC|nr:Tdc2 [Cordylochernes scorpioides]